MKYIRKFILSEISKAKNFRGDYVVLELKEWSRELGDSLNTYRDRCFKFSYTYLGRSDYRHYRLAEVGSQLLSDIENLGSALSWKVRSAILILRLSFVETVTRSLAERGLCELCVRACVCERVSDSFARTLSLKFLKNGWIAIVNHRSSL